VGVSVAVLGVGPLGLCHLIKARLLGAGTIIATDLLPGRLEKAAPFGVDLALDASTTDLRQRKEAVLAATDGRGPDVVLDCSGVPDTFVEALEIVRPGGVVVEAGTFVDMGPVGINPNSAVCTRNVSILGIGGEIATGYGPSMRLLAANIDRYDLRSIVSHRYALEDASEALAMAQSGESMQVAFDPALR
jgi:L-iditol 2-dehydrogenase